MTASFSARRVLFVTLAAAAIAACDSANGQLSPDPSKVQPESVSVDALRAAVDDDKQMRQFYDAAGWQAVWDGGRARQLVEALDQAQAHGLSTNQFLEQAPADPAQREAALTKAAISYASALANGFTDPADIRDIYSVPRPKTDIVAGLARAVSDNRVSDWLASLSPQTEDYRALSRAFVHYLQLAQREGQLEIDGGDPIVVGDSDPRVPRIVEALAANNYLDPQQLRQPAPPAYTPQIAQAVQRIQVDYGIKPDGIVGEDTLRVLNAGAADRARQLAVNLERLRWLDRNPPATRIDVNTGAAFLDYWRDGRHLDHRRVVVGEPGWETPQLGSPIFRLVANPTWTVPKSIAEEELADKGPGYFRANNMVMKDGWWVQQSGPTNSLGLVKFDMQNDHAIYLHDTPHKALFADNERHRSHGCVRVDDALGFAHLIARADGVLPEFQKALASGKEAFIKLNREVPVRLMYHTAFFRDGKVQFRTDAYGWDEDVARALGREAREQRRAAPHERGRDIGP